MNNVKHYEINLREKPGLHRQDVSVDSYVTEGDEVIAPVILGDRVYAFRYGKVIYSGPYYCSVELDGNVRCATFDRVQIMQRIVQKLEHTKDGWKVPDGDFDRRTLNLAIKREGSVTMKDAFRMLNEEAESLGLNPVVELLDGDEVSEGDVAI